MREIAAEVSGVVRGSPERVFDVFAPVDLRLILEGYGPLPAVAAIEDQTGDWDAVGQTRTVRLRDGSRMREELTRVERPHHFAYRIDGLTSPLRLLVVELRGAWWFEPSDGNTRARWRYELEPRSALTRPLAALVVRLLWRPYMQRALERATELAER